MIRQSNPKNIRPTPVTMTAQPMQDAGWLDSNPGASPHQPCIGWRQVRVEAPVKASASPDRITAAGLTHASTRLPPDVSGVRIKP